MSGGGNQVMKGGMRASVCAFSPEEVKEFVAAYEKASARLHAIRQEKSALEQAIDITEKEIAEYQLREEKCNMDIASLTKQSEAPPAAHALPIVIPSRPQNGSRSTQAPTSTPYRPRLNAEAVPQTGPRCMDSLNRP